MKLRPARKIMLTAGRCIVDPVNCEVVLVIDSTRMLAKVYRDNDGLVGATLALVVGEV